MHVSQLTTALPAVSFTPRTAAVVTQNSESRAKQILRNALRPRLLTAYTPGRAGDAISLFTETVTRCHGPHLSRAAIFHPPGPAALGGS
jgi:hypothetical protein